MLMERFEVKDENGRSNCWAGGQLDQGSGYWGGYADQETIKQAVREAIQAQQELEEEETVK